MDWQVVIIVIINVELHIDINTLIWMGVRSLHRMTLQNEETA